MSAFSAFQNLFNDNSVSFDQYKSQRSKLVQSLPDSYKTQFENNPYLTTSYSPNFWDKFVNFFGGRSSYDKYMEEMFLNAKQYDSQLTSLAREEDYNDATSQVAREKAAGLNPDLVGTSLNSAGAASEFTEPTTIPQMPEQPIQDFFTTCGGVMSSLLGIAKDFYSIKGLSLSNDNSELLNESQDIANFQSALVAGTSAFKHYANLNDFTFSKDADLDNIIFPDLSTILGSGDNKEYFRSQKAYNRVNSAYLRFQKSLLGDSTLKKLFVDSIKNKRESYQYTESKKTDKQIKDVFGVIGDAVVDISKLNIELQKSDIETQQSVNSYNKSSAESEMRNLEAKESAEKSFYEQSTQENQTQTDINSVTSSLIEKLSNMSDEGNVWASIGLILLQYAPTISSFIPKPASKKTIVHKNASSK